MSDTTCENQCGAGSGDIAAPSGTGGLGSISDIAGDLLNGARAVVADQLLLVMLEARRAGTSLVIALCYSSLAVMLSLLALVSALAALSAGLIHVGWPRYAAYLIDTLVCLVCILCLTGAIRRRMTHLLFPATMRSLRGTAAAGGQSTDR